jgi:hypothetical protein
MVCTWPVSCLTMIRHTAASHDDAQKEVNRFGSDVLCSLTDRL